MAVKPSDAVSEDDPKEPVVPGAPAEPVEPTEPTEPTEPAEPVGPPAPTAEPAEPAEPASPAEPTAAELATQARLKELEEENVRLKGGGAEPAEHPSGPSQRPSYIQHFISTTKPQAERSFAEINPVRVKDDGSVVVDTDAQKRQFGVIFDMTDQMVGSVLADRVEPVLDKLAEKTILLDNALELMQLLSEQPGVKAFVKTIQAELARTSWADRTKPGVVRNLYHRLLGASNGARPAAPRPSASPAALRDVSAGGASATRKPVTVRLTPEQEADFQDIAAESPGAITREQYYAKFKARADLAKQKNRPIPKTLRG